MMVAVRVTGRKVWCDTLLELDETSMNINELQTDRKRGRHSNAALEQENGVKARDY